MVALKEVLNDAKSGMVQEYMYHGPIMIDSEAEYNKPLEAGDGRHPVLHQVCWAKRLPLEVACTCWDTLCTIPGVRPPVSSLAQGGHPFR